jgi:hypothetical protein
VSTTDPIGVMCGEPSGLREAIEQCRDDLIALPTVARALSQSSRAIDTDVSSDVEKPDLKKILTRFTRWSEAERGSQPALAPFSAHVQVG